MACQIAYGAIILTYRFVMYAIEWFRMVEWRAPIMVDGKLKHPHNQATFATFRDCTHVCNVCVCIGPRLHVGLVRL